MIVTVIIAVAAAMLSAAAVLTLFRLARGPGTLDRVVAGDVVIAILICGLALEAALNRHVTTLPVILVLALLGFAGSLSVARFAADRDQAISWRDPDGGNEGRGWEDQR
ncbi:monovalent cation/H+ antiporter complex subunit F [Naumannella huperziae]